MTFSWQLCGIVLTWIFCRIFGQLSDEQEAERKVTLSKNISATLNHLVNPARYDKRLRPNYGGNPVKVGITIHVSSISAVSEVAMDYTLDMYLREMWEDPRLKFAAPEGVSSLTIDVTYLKSIWVPDTFFPNEKKSFFHIATTHNSFLRIDPKGSVKTSQRLTVTAACTMALHLFPLDSQECILEIESYGYSTADIELIWNDGPIKSIDLSDEVKLPQFVITDHKIDNITAVFSTGSYSRLRCRFLFTRSIGFYMIQIYLPSILIVIISWVSFWLSRDATPARVSLGVTTVLTMTTLMTTTNAAMPKVSYIKSIDIYLGTCFLMVFASLLEYAAVGYLNKRLRMQKEKSSKNKPTANGQMASIKPIPMHLGPSGTPAHRPLLSNQDNPPPYMSPMNDHRLPYQPECDCDLERAVLKPLKKSPPKRKTVGVTPSGIDKYSRIVFPLVSTPSVD